MIKCGCSPLGRVFHFYLVQDVSGRSFDVDAVV